jgi:hypothetical protein
MLSFGQFGGARQFRRAGCIIPSQLTIASLGPRDSAKAALAQMEARGCGGDARCALLARGEGSYTRNGFHDTVGVKV